MCVESEEVKPEEDYTRQSLVLIVPLSLSKT